MGDGETDHRAVWQVDRTLHQSFAKGTTADNQTSVLILNGSCDNLCGRGRIAIDEHHYPAVHKSTVAISGIVRTGHLPSIGIDDEITPMQELVCDIDGSFQIAATVLLKVENQMLHTLRLQLAEALNELLMRRRAEIADADIADAWTNHIGGIDGMDRNLVADNGKLECLADARTHYTQLHLHHEGAS